MTKSFPIEHFDGEEAHGPVTLFISDDGRLAFVCSQDDVTWEIDTKAKPTRQRQHLRDSVDERDTVSPTSDIGRDQAARARMLKVARQILS